MAESRSWTYGEDCTVAGAMLGQLEGDLFARGLTVLRRGDGYLIVERWAERDAHGTELDAREWADRVRIDEASVIVGPAPVRGLVLWVFGENFGDVPAALRRLGPSVLAQAEWPHPTPRTAVWVNELAAAPVRDEWANEALTAATRYLIGASRDPVLAVREAERAFYLRRRPAFDDAALLVSTLRLTDATRAERTLASFRLSFERVRESFEERLQHWERVAAEQPAARHSSRKHRWSQSAAAASSRNLLRAS